ncbi:MAG: hypothetical protein ACRDSJ_25295, partial [Rubrobacteraceae bacterium]
TCWLHKPESVGIKDERIWVEYGGIEGVMPLEHSDLFTSFAKLAAYGKPSEARIRRWVSRFGLPAKGLEWRQGEPINPDSILDGDSEASSGLSAAIKNRLLETVRPAGHSMLVKDFRDEAQYAHDLLSAYIDVRERDVEAIKARVTSSGSRLNRQFRKSFEADKDYWRLASDSDASGERPNELTVLIAQNAVGEIITDLVSAVRLRAGAAQKQGLCPTHECSDLFSALYLQLFMLATNSKPIRYCENCSQPFEATRKNKKTCNDSCRSAASKKRRKF